MGDLEHYLGFGLGLLAMTGLTVGLARWAGIGLGLFPLWAILEVPWTVVLFLALMLTTASWTSVRRLDQLWRGRRAAVIGVLAGALVTLVAVFALQLVDLGARYLIAVAGIIIGNATGLVTLPGAFVGALFGGASPAEAAQFQLVVLAGIALAMMVTSIVVTQIVGRTPYLATNRA